MAGSGSKPALVIGLDFGTTFSGVAFCESHNRGSAKEAHQIQLYSAWPGKGGGGTEKVPSRITYGENPPHSQVEWGYDISLSAKGKIHALMKLKLDKRIKNKQLEMLIRLLTNLENFSLNDDDDDESDEEEGPPDYPGKSPVDIVADYLTEIRKNVWAELERMYGQVTLANLDRELVVTVPAVWSERAKDLTLQAVTRADFKATKIMLVTEPEAAAIYTLKGMVEGASKDDVQVGDLFVLCDAGGGTVDLISYKITQISPVFKMEEAVIGSGDKCGATFVDQEFLSWLQGWIGSDAYKAMPRSKVGYGSRLMTSFETSKFGFSGTEEGIVTLPRECGIEDDPDKNIEDRDLHIPSDIMQTIFDPCVDRTISLINGQVEAIAKATGGKPKMVLVVGGFGRNDYLYNKISEYCRGKGILTRRPPFPWSAVVRGAVCRGLEGPSAGLVAMRLARKHYGTYTSQRFMQGVHHPDDAYIDKITGLKYARGQMNWLVKKGERLPEDSPRKVYIECFAEFKMDDDREFGAQLVGCDADEAPRRYAEDSAYNICRVRADLSTVPMYKFTKARSGLDAEEYYIAEFRLEATFCSGVVEWSFIFDGKEYGSVSVSYDK